MSTMSNYATLATLKSHISQINTHLNLITFTHIPEHRHFLSQIPSFTPTAPDPELTVSHIRGTVHNALQNDTLKELMTTSPSVVYEYAQENLRHMDGQLAMLLVRVQEVNRVFTELRRIDREKGMDWGDVEVRMEGILLAYTDAASRAEEIKRMWPALGEPLTR